jgi:hypothetical protein
LPNRHPTFDRLAGESQPAAEFFARNKVAFRSRHIAKSVWAKSIAGEIVCRLKAAHDDV